MKQLKQWLHAHPLKAVAFTFVFTLLPALFAVTSGDIHAAIGVAWLCLIVIATLEYIGDMRRLLCALLFVSLLPTKAPADDQPKAVGATVAVVVIVVGGVATYYLVKFCQRHFQPPPPPPTNSPPEQFSAAADGDYAAAFTFLAPGSCFTPSSENSIPPPGVCELGALITDAGIVSQPILYRPSTDDNLLSWAEFNTALGAHGIYIPNVGEMVFGADGKPASALDVPITVSVGTSPSIAIAGGPSKTVLLERSPDLISWSPVITNTLPVGMTLRLEDDGAEQMFYRWSTL